MDTIFELYEAPTAILEDYTSNAEDKNVPLPLESVSRNPNFGRPAIRGKGGERLEQGGRVRAAIVGQGLQLRTLNLTLQNMKYIGHNANHNGLTLNICILFVTTNSLKVTHDRSITSGTH